VACGWQGTLAKEKQLTRERDALAAERRQLPWMKVEKNYVFDSPGGKKTLSDLFDGRSVFRSDFNELPLSKIEAFLEAYGLAVCMGPSALSGAD
jgi:hypothetical protein